MIENNCLQNISSILIINYNSDTYNLENPNNKLSVKKNDLKYQTEYFGR